MKTSMIYVCAMVMGYVSMAQTKDQDTMNLKALTINLISSSVNESMEFYQSVLGFEVIQSLPGENDTEFAILQRDNVTIMFQSQSGFVSEFPDYTNTPIGGTVMLYIDVNDVKNIYDQVLENGIELFVELNTTFYNAKEFAIKDNDGYILIFAEDQSDQK